MCKRQELEEERARDFRNQGAIVSALGEGLAAWGGWA